MTDAPGRDRAVVGVVLAGGASTRFGDGNKALARLGDRTMIERAVDALATATVRPPVVAVRTAEQRERYEAVLDGREVRFVRDAERFEGPLAGLFGAFEAVDAHLAFVCGCDMPLLSAPAIEWLTDRSRRRSSDSDASAPDALVVRQPDGVLTALHAVYRCRAVERVQEDLPRTGGLRAVLRALDDVAVVSPDVAPRWIRLRESVTNVNTSEELADLRERSATA